MYSNKVRAKRARKIGLCWPCFRVGHFDMRYVHMCVFKPCVSICFRARPAACTIAAEKVVALGPVRGGHIVAPLDLVSDAMPS